MKKVALICFLAIYGSNAFADFQSPDGNVICGDVGGMLMCYLHKQDNKKPALPKPKDCDGDWGDMFSLEARGKAKIECSFDYPFQTQGVKTLPYGSSIKGSGWQCMSEKTGMICKNSQGHGFTLNRKKQTLF